MMKWKLALKKNRNKCQKTAMNIWKKELECIPPLSDSLTPRSETFEQEDEIMSKKSSNKVDTKEERNQIRKKTN